MDNNQAQGFTEEQRGELAKWSAERQARLTARGQGPAVEGTVEDRLRALDAAFEARPDRDNPLVQENHELRRMVEILDDAVRKIMNGELPMPLSA